MRRIHTIAHFADDGSVTLKAPGLAAAGTHPVTLLVEDRSSEAAGLVAISQAALDKVWDNPEDAVYDTL